MVFGGFWEGIRWRREAAQAGRHGQIYGFRREMGIEECDDATTPARGSSQVSSY